ncbi:MAG: hypothetical protein LBD55_02360 [Treponema sp.]|nr:hypothetical protein [Treponema sp.]
MKKNKVFFLMGMFSLLLAFGLVLSGCPVDPRTVERGSGTVTPNEPEPGPDIPGVTKVTIENGSGSPDVVQGADFQFTAKSQIGDDLTGKVTWSVEGGVPETLITVTGKLTVARSETASQLKVKAVFDEDPSIVASFMVTVKPRPPEPLSAARGGTRQFTATVEGFNSPAQTVTWSVQDAVTGSGPSAGTGIDAGGLLTVSPAETALALIVTAVSTADPSISGSIEAGVTDPAITIELDTSAADLVPPSDPAADYGVIPGGTYQFTAKINGLTSQRVQWQIQGSSYGSSFDVTGKLTVGINEAASNLKIRATADDDASKSDVMILSVVRGSGSISISNTAAGDISAGSISIAPLSGPSTGAFTLSGPSGYAQYRWLIDGVAVSPWASGSSYTIPANTLTDGVYWVTLQVKTADGIYYSAMKSFTVAPATP